MKSSEKILTALQAAGIKYEHYIHAPIISAADRYPQKLDFGAVVCKNLLVTTRSESRFLLAMFPCEKAADLKAMRAAFGTSRLCFASEQALLRLLDQVSGSVGVLSIVNDTARTVEVVLDSALAHAPRIAMHPGVNTETVVLCGEELARFVSLNGRRLSYLDF